MSLSIAFILTLVIALIFLRIVDFIASRGVISSQLSRKIVHIGTGPIFVLCWFLFPDESISRYIAAIVPLLITIQFLLIGVGIIKDQASVDAMSRTGNPREILKGPLFYGLIFIVVTIFFWKDFLVGIIALMILCGGDGFADIFGRRMKSGKLKWAENKTIAGTVAMFLGGFIFSWIISAIFYSTGNYSFSFVKLTQIILILSAFAALVESLPVKDYDNLTVPVTTIILGLLLF